MAAQGRVTAVLGPTNTGKTHYAIERMLGHRTGVIGFPLRLLAREVYDRVRAIKGDKQVALITGEERIEPPDARYFLCTAEAMPRTSGQHAFVALDEHGERSFSFYRPPAADLLFRAAHFTPACFEGTGVFHVCSNSLTGAEIADATYEGMRRARESGATVSIDALGRFQLTLDQRPGVLAQRHRCSCPLRRFHGQP